MADQYIITEEKLKQMVQSDNLITREKIAFSVLSYPLSSTLKKIDVILKHKRGCLTCRSPDCPVWQAADQNCWKSEKEALKCQTCGGIVTHPMCDNCYENNIGNIRQEALKAERERVLKPFVDYADTLNEIECCVIQYKMREMIKSLRSEQP